MLKIAVVLLAVSASAAFAQRKHAIIVPEPYRSDQLAPHLRPQRPAPNINWSVEQLRRNLDRSCEHPTYGHTHPACEFLRVYMRKALKRLDELEQATAKQPQPGRGNPRN